MSATRYPFLTMRLWELHRNPTELDAYLALLSRQRLACDEVWFATDYGFPPLAVHQAAAEQMASAAERVRATGIVASLQISNTLGHGDYLKYLDFRGIGWQRMVGSGGEVAPYSNCPRDPAFHAYLSTSVRAYCSWEPDSVWIDDDLRMHHHSPVSHGCFCDRCLAAFSAASGGSWSREPLVAAINEGNDLAARLAWLEFGRQSLAGVAGVIAQAVKAVAPSCRMGLQHSDHAWGGYNGPDWAPIFETMARVSGRPVGSRPGGGFYVDHAPREMIGKAVFGGLQNSRLPSCVDDVRVEVENLPGAVTGKSARGTAVEATLALAYGSTGLTFTPLMFTHEEIAWHERVLSEIASWRPFWLAYHEASRGTRAAGLAIALSRQFTRRRLAVEERPFAWASCQLGSVPQLATLGLPLCWAEAATNGTLLYPNAVDGMDEGEIRALARRGVVTDGETILRMQERGHGAWLNMSVTPALDTDANELLTDDALTGAYPGRVAGLSGLSSTFRAYALRPSDASARILSNYVRPDGELSSPATVAFQTAEGGRWVVFGNGCWSPVMTTARRALMLAAADWVSPEGLPALLETPGQTVVIPRIDAEGRTRSVLLLNCSLDATPSELRLNLRRPRGATGRWARPHGETTQIELLARADEAFTVALPGLGPWGVGALLLE